MKFEELQARNAIAVAVKELFGIVGSAIQIDILKLKNNYVYLRVPFDCKNVVLASLPLITTYAGVECQFQVIDQSPFLISIADCVL